MNIKPTAYGNLCSIFYDITKAYAPEREINFYASFMQKDANHRILEAMSGSGRLLIPLMQRGYIIDGVDNSTIMLDRCRERCAQLNLTPELYTQSITELNLLHKYATVTIAVGSFQLITDKAIALQALKSIRAHMRDNGNLLIDIFIPDMTRPTPSTRTAQINNHTIIRLTTRDEFHEEKKRADAFCTYELIEYGIVQKKEQELIQVTWYTDTEFTGLLKQAGFNVVKIYEENLRPGGPSRIVHAKAV
ncbi:MAG: class I SAM-dependent methyltransferase [bacterium]